MFASQFVDSSNDIVSDREALPGAAVVATTGAEVHEVVRTLGVESRAKSNAGNGTGLHGVIRKCFNCKVDVITKIEVEMSDVSRRPAGDDRDEADGGRNAIKSRDIVEHG